MFHRFSAVFSGGDIFEEAVENITETVGLYLETDDEDVNRLN